MGDGMRLPARCKCGATVLLDAPLRWGEIAICAACVRQFDEDTKHATEAANARGEGFKADSDKPRWDLLPWGPVEDVVRVLTVGARKYAPDNWQKVPDARRRYFSAAVRHLVAWERGERVDPETGLPRLAHATCCLLFAAWFDRQGAASSLRQEGGR